MSVLVSPGADAAQKRARRRARLADAARMLPFLGAVLFLLPDLILSGGSGAEGATAPWLGYLFATWAVLIGLAFRIGQLHRRETDSDSDSDVADVADEPDDAEPVGFKESG